MTLARFEPAGALRGTLRPPPDKSISHRAAIVAAMAEGRSRVGAYLDAADTRSTLEAVRALGAGVEALGASEAPGGVELAVEGVGLRGPVRDAGSEPLAIDVGNAGTLLRLLPGWLAGQSAGRFVLDGDESIRARPVDRIAEPLRAMGATVRCRDGRLPPLRVEAAPLTGAVHRSPVASAQVKSCLLLAGLLAEGETTVVEPSPSRDHTERILGAAGVRVAAENEPPGLALGGSLPARRVSVGAAERLEPLELDVPGDFSSAAFHVVAAVLVPRSRVRLDGVGLNPTRVGLLGVLSRMGAAIEVEESAHSAGEPVGSVDARHGPLRGVRVAPGEVPLAIDELPLIALAGCFAEGDTVIEGAGELRHKESDRIASVVTGLRALGGDIEASGEKIRVRGAGELAGGRLDPRSDHRLAMLGAVAGLASRDGVDVDMSAAAVSYPGFAADLRSLLAGGRARP